MFTSKSRYAHVREFDGVDGAGRFPGTRPRPIEPIEGVLVHTLATGERLDLLALHYYDDARLWWLILDANPQLGYGGAVDLGEHIGETIVLPGARRRRGP